MLTTFRSSLSLRPHFSSRKAFYAMSSKSSDLKYPDPVVLKAKSPSWGTVIFLHGLGDSGYGWQDGMAAIQRQLPHVKFICPTAPTRPVTCNMGMRMTAWYDIMNIASIEDGEDEAGLNASKEYVLSLVKAEVDAGTPSEKIIIGGFSQGGATTYHTVFSGDIKFAGALVLSSYLPLHKTFPDRFNKTNIDTPLFVCHGTADPLLPCTLGKLSFEQLQKVGVKGSFTPYKNMAHSASVEELMDVAKWIGGILTEPKL